ncbi:TonB-dependent siderophore receptor [Methylobacterium sp. PvR107]|uniref:TonB-dependent siderophore receptor n=1 Tax=Methylobacterium sp. PvR107 TaxID=2806597 RepID=UPI001AE7E46C|nr:TonB-dependent siderophore receptor [Methylobacterium sp. PvR107]MBP1181205.1 iron complex outermembrane receptor protein [Methylobacterium sp. PvR107]
MRSVRLTVLLASTALTGSALAQEAKVQLNEISVEAAGPSPAAAAVSGAGGNVSGGDGNSSATSGGGGGPSGITGYVARVSPAATKTNTALIETPQSVSVVTREQLNDRNVQSVNEALAYTPGVSSNVFGFDPRFDAFYIRGFAATNNGVFRDGLRQPGVGQAVARIEPYGTEALTILRGPSSGLYGLGSPGGIVDITSKRPVFVPFGEVWFQGGNFDRTQGNFDIGSPIEGSDGTLAFRLTGAFREANTFLPSGSDNRFTIAPALTWKPSADTTVTLLTEFQHSKAPGTSAFYTAPGFVITRLYQGDAAFNALNQDSYRIGYAFEHRFSDDLIFRQNVRYQNIDSHLAYTQIDSVTGLSAQRENGLIHDRLGYVAVDNQLEAHLVTGPVSHTLLAGVDYLHYDYRRDAGFGLIPDLNLAGVGDFSTFRSRTFVPRPALASASEQAQDQIGLYIQEQAKFDRFVLTLTGRQDFVSQSTRAGTPGSLGAARSQDDSAFTGRAGLNYLLAPGLVPYASYATTFTPQLGVDINGRPFKAATGDQIEAGVKYALPDTNITGSFAGFDIVQSSVLQTDPTNVANQVASGSVQSKGFEAELTANVAPGTNLTVAYTHLDLRYRNATFPGTTQSISGNAVSGIPGDTFAAFGTYQFPPASPLRGLQIGGGIRYTSTSFADDLNTVRNPTVTQFDALVAYDFAALDPKYKGFRAQINAFNIFDRNYDTCQSGFCYRGAPATVIGSLIYRW